MQFETSFCGHAVSQAHHCPFYREKKTKMLQLYLYALMTPVSTTTTHDVFPHHFSFQKLADPRIVGPFTRMTSLTQTVPTVLNKARACFSVWVPLLHWDCYERCEWVRLTHCVSVWVTERERVREKIMRTKLFLVKMGDNRAFGHQHSQQHHFHPPVDLCVLRGEPAMGLQNIGRFKYSSLKFNCCTQHFSPFTIKLILSVCALQALGFCITCACWILGPDWLTIFDVINHAHWPDSYQWKWREVTFSAMNVKNTVFWVRSTLKFGQPGSQGPHRIMISPPVSCN